MADEEKTEEKVDAEPEKVRLLFLRGQPRQLQVNFALITLANTLIYTAFSNPSSFLFMEALQRGVNTSTAGLIFGSFEFVAFAFSPIIGNFVTQIGYKRAFLVGLTLLGVTNILFGVVGAASGTLFTVLAIATRMSSGLGSAAVTTASFALTPHLFPLNVASALGTVELVAGVGIVAGPLVGGVLHQAGGFGLPFYVVGGLLVALAVATNFFLKVDDVKAEEGTAAAKTSILGMLKSPLVLILILTTASTTFTFGFMDATFATHMEQFHLSTSVIGLLLMIMAGTYAVCSPFVGWIADSKKIILPFPAAGSLLMAVCQLFVGPSPLLPFKQTLLPVVVVCLFFQGIGSACTIVTSIKGLYLGARRLGRTGPEVNGQVAGLFLFAFHFGTFLGPTLGSIVLQTLNFKWATTLTAGILLLPTILLCSHYVVEKYCCSNSDVEEKKDQSEKTSLADGSLPSYTDKEPLVIQ